MKRLQRRLFNIAVGVSMVLCVSFVSLWILSSFRPGGVQLESPQGHFGVYWAGGTFCLSHADSAYPSWRIHRVDPAKLPSEWYWFTFYCSSATVLRDGNLVVEYGRMKFPAPVQYRLLGAPLWVIAAPFAVLPATAAAASRRRRHRVGHGLCLVCGYDLRATPDRCPECGTLPEPAKGVAT